MNITVIGAGKSGLSAALLAARKENKVFLTESKAKENYSKEVDTLSKCDIDYEFGGNTEKALTNTDLIISSPGVNPEVEIIKKAEAANIPIISEIEYASRFLKNKIIAITGTNGKTTTTTLTDYIINRSGMKSVPAGNIGRPLADLVDNIDEDVIITLELSSFQLDRISQFKPNVSIILNITPDHLYYHKTFENYAQAKFNIAKNLTKSDILILNADDSEITSRNINTNGEILYFSMNPLENGAYSKDGSLYLKLPNMQKEEEIMLLKDIRLPGIHNAYNSMAAALAARVFEIRNENIRDSLMAFEGVEHRLEYVRSIEGVDYINDSKATNINAAWFALASYEKPIVWLAGGRGDNNDYSALDAFVEKNVKSIICFGEEKEAIFDHFCLSKRCIKADTFEDAVNQAKEQADFGEVVLFSPACKSFDMFMNFEQRGEVFKEIVNSL